MGKMKDEVCIDTPHDQFCPLNRCTSPYCDCECLCQMIHEIRIDERMRMHNV